jgi:heptosyltransferase-2
VNKILVIQTAFLGDVILTTPLISELKLQYPHASIDVMAIPIGGEVWKNNPDVSSVIIYDKRGKDKGIVPFVNLVLRIRKKKYDWIVSPHRSLRSAAISFFSGSPKRTAFDTSTGKFLYNDLVSYNRNIHEVQRNLSLLSTEDPDKEKKPRIFPSEKEKDRVEAILLKEGLKIRKFAALAPGSVWATKRWPESYFVTLVERLKKENISVALIGGKSDMELSERIIAKAGWGVNLAGKLNPRESFYLVKKSACLLTNDSAPLHLGSAAGVPTVAVFGATIPEFGFGPYGRHPQVVLEAGHLACRPCGIHGSQKCAVGTFACMMNISPETVWNNMRRFLQ